MGFDTTFNAFNISSSGMTAERFRMEVVANNIANSSVTRTPEGGPYRRKDVVFETALNRNSPLRSGLVDASGLGGVIVAGVVDDQSELPRVLNQGHPDADDDGFVTMP